MPKRDNKDSPLEVGCRRSQRVLMDLPLIIRGELEDKGAFQEETFTLTVSAHGVLALLAKSEDLLDPLPHIVGERFRSDWTRGRGWRRVDFHWSKLRTVFW